jgi:hypothetical protein
MFVKIGFDIEVEKHRADATHQPASVGQQIQAGRQRTTRVNISSVNEDRGAPPTFEKKSAMCVGGSFFGDC